MDPNLIRTLSRYCDIEAFLGVLSEKSVSPCILTEIVYVVLYTSQIAKESRLLEVHDFIVTLLARLQDYSKHSFSYFKCGTSKIRRRSMDCGVLDTPTMDFIAKLKTKASFNCLGDLAVILMNYSLGVVMEGETTSKNCRFQSEEGMRLLYHFQSFANKDTKRLILSFLMSQLESSQDSYDFCCSSLHLHMIVEDCLQRELPPALHILARRLYYVLLSYQLRKEGSFEDYYIFLRQTGQQDLVKVEILGQVIKEGSLLQQHLCTLLLILEFEYISGPMP